MLLTLQLFVMELFTSQLLKMECWINNFLVTLQRLEMICFTDKPQLWVLMTLHTLELH
jgi:hypothetical protein